jgi:hypothetical protein
VQELRSPNILLASLEAWAKKSPAYRDLYKTMSKKIVHIAKDGLSELTSVTPMSWQIWWSKEHNRFIRQPGVTQRELLVLHEIMHQFLTAYARGELGREDKKGGKTAKSEASSVDRVQGH